MKRYNITVNGTAYDVAVEEIGADGGASAAAETRPVKPAAKPAPAGAAGDVKINAPMPGTIVEVMGKAGGSVKAGTVIAVLEAMKMENDITAPSDGVIVSVNVAKGEQVNTGTLIATMTV
ncbi:MAG: biotin/lipoyl-binding protein [Oscillospiraceae bacterium]|jgi:biotin carboxyl carrier protein|nr:biotin/lipoyl-binding protein [Oscillospiraceae bacterium]